MYKVVLGIFSLIFLSGLANSQELVSISQDTKLSLIKSKILKINENWDIVFIEKSPLKDFYRVNISDGKVIYYSDSTGYFFEGDLYKQSGKGMINVTDINAKERRKELISKIDINNTIVYKPKGEIKAVVYAFMDVDCGACRNLHKQTSSMNELGIEIRYLAYPRAGLFSETYQKMTTAWCSKKRKQKIDDLMVNKRSPLNLCKDSPVIHHYKLGRQIGLKGTPGIVLMDGTLLHGYRAANKLAQELSIH